MWNGKFCRPFCRLMIFGSLLLVFNACDPRSGSKESSRPIDVPPAIEVDISTDPQAPPRKPTLTGVLPSDFPEDLPLYLPASLVDFGTSPAGLQTVSLLTADPMSHVRQELDALLSRRGWTASERGNGNQTLRKGGQEVGLIFEDANPGTLYRYEYSG